MSTATIVMYHYVRELPMTRYPRIKGLLASAFVEQVEYMRRFYRFVTVAECIDAAHHGAPLPPNAALLTFDDGYAEHFQTVFPWLEERKIQGCFFPSAKAVAEHRVLDVNKIHYVLAAGDQGDVLSDVYDALDELRPVYGLSSTEEYFARLARANRFDSKEIIFIKRLLQHALPAHVRQRITDRLFRRYVTQDETAFACELYVSVDQLRCMSRHGMYVGSHGYEHCWMNTITPEHQAREIDLSLAFLRQVGAPTTSWVMCYPHGAYDESLLRQLEARGCRLGLTVKPELAIVDKRNALELSRLDTNDLPRERGAAPNPWTQRVINEAAR